MPKISAETASTTIPVDTDVFLTDESMTTTPATKRKAWSTLMTSPVLRGTVNGWISANETWAYASATTITVPTGAAAKYYVGDRLTWTANSVVLYAYVIAVADTVLTVAGNTVTNFTFSANYYSTQVSPLLFPQWFAYTPTGISAANVTHTGRFSINGRMCTVQYHAAMTGAVTFTTMPTLPITASAGIITTKGPCGVATTKAAGTITHNGLIPHVLASGTTLNLTTAADANMSATVPGTWANGDYIDAFVQYEI